MTGLAKLDHLQRRSRIFRSDRTDIAASTDFGIWTCLEQCPGPSSLAIRTLGNQWIHCLENKKKSCDKIKCLFSLKIQAAQPQYTCGHCHYSNGREHKPPPGGGTPLYKLYKLYRYVPPHRVVVRRFVLKTGINFAHFGSGIALGFSRELRESWTYLSFQFQMRNIWLRQQQKQQHLLFKHGGF